MTPEERADRLCAALVRDGVCREDGRVVRQVRESAAKEFAAWDAEAEAEQKALRPLQLRYGV